MPRHVAHGVIGPVSGRLVDYGATIKLVTRYDGKENRHDLDFVVWCTPFGGKEEGFQKWPRPWVYDLAGAVVEEGDWLLVDFVNGDYRAPVVLSVVQALNLGPWAGVGSSSAGKQLAGSPDFARDPRGATGDAHDRVNELIGRLAPQAQGIVTGDVRFFGGRNGQGEMEVEAFHRLLFGVGPDYGGPATIKALLEGLILKVSRATGTTEPVPLGRTLLTDLSAVCDDVIAIGAALGIPATGATAMKTAIAASLSAGLPYLSTTLESE
jgi:hypothetical protein